MNKFGFDADALAGQLAKATATQGEAVRAAVHKATLQSLRGRELTLKSIRDTVQAVTKAVSAGAAENQAGADVDALLASAVAGMDAAVLRAVEASRRALEQLVQQGVDLQERQFRKAMADLEKMEDTFFAAIDKATGDASAGLQGPWAEALKGFRQEGSAIGDGAAQAIQSLTRQSQAAMRESRALGQRAAQAMLDHYAALASGVLIGMSDAMARRAAPAKPAPDASDAPAAAKRPRAKG